MWVLLAVTATAVLRGGEPEAADTTVVFDYGKHGQDWVLGKCGSRARQSPIDVPGNFLAEPPAVGQKGVLPVRYQVETEFLVANNGHCIHVDVEDEGLGGLTFENAWYNLLAVNLHAPGEHTLAGGRPQLELHLVHKRYDSDALAIIAVPFEPVPGPPAATNATNATAGSVYVRPDPTMPGYTNLLEVFMERPPPDVDGAVAVVADLDLNAMVRGNFVSYDGSLTAPPCSENVRWFVRQAPLSASAEQVDRLLAATLKMNPQGNWRVALPLGDRALTVVSTTPTEPALTAKGPVASPADGTTLSERAAMQWGYDAVSQSMAHLAHLKNLDQRLRKAADAHAVGLQPPQPVIKAPAGAQGGPDGPLYYPSAVAKGLSQALSKAMDESIKSLQGRIHPGTAAQTAVAGLRGHLNSADASGRATLQAENVGGA